MSIFSTEALSRLNSIGDSKVRAYLYKLNEDLEYMFNNITAEDNFSSDAYVAYQESLDTTASLEVSVSEIRAAIGGGKSIAELRADVEGIKASFTSDGIVQKINLASSGVTISGSKINLVGAVTANGNFKINTDGSMSCKNASISGTFAVGSTWTARDGTVAHAFDVMAGGKTYANYFYAGAISANGIACGGLDCPDGTIYADNFDASSEVNCAYLIVSTYVSSPIYYRDSDRRLKKNIESLSQESCEALIRNLEPVRFQYIKSGIDSTGFIAQDVQKAMDDTGTDFPLVIKKDDGYLALDYMDIIPIIIKVLQKLLKERND